MHMPGNYNTSRFIQAARLRGQKMANARWARDRERRDALARVEAIDPLRVPGRIVQRVIVIRADQTAVEIIKRDTTTAREWKRMKREAGLL